LNLEYDAASAGKGAGTTRLVEVEVSGIRCRTKDIPVGIHGHAVVQRIGSVARTEEGIQNRLRPRAAAGIGRQLVDSAAAGIHKPTGADSSGATATLHCAVQIPGVVDGEAVKWMNSIGTAWTPEIVDDAFLNFAIALGR